MIETTLHQIEQEIFSESGDGTKEFVEWERLYWKNHRNRYKINLESVKKFAVGNRVLEIGSVPCHFTALLTALGYEVAGVDPIPERANKLIRRYSLNVAKCDIEIDSLPFDDNSFETIVLSEVIEHLYVNPLHALREIKRVLSPRGNLLLFTPSFYSLQVLRNIIIGNSINDVVEEWKKFEVLGHRGHVRVYSSREVCGLLSLVGLNPIRKKYFQYNDSIFSRFKYLFVPSWLYPSQLIVASKNNV